MMKRIILISILIVFGSLTGSPFPLEKQKIDAHGFVKLGAFRTDGGAESVGGDILVINLEEVQEPIVETGIELFLTAIRMLSRLRPRKLRILMYDMN